MIYRPICKYDKRTGWLLDWNTKLHPSILYGRTPCSTHWVIIEGPHVLPTGPLLKDPMFCSTHWLIIEEPHVLPTGSLLKDTIVLPTSLLLKDCMFYPLIDYWRAHWKTPLFYLLVHYWRTLCSTHWLIIEGPHHSTHWVIIEGPHCSTQFHPLVHYWRTPCSTHWLVIEGPHCSTNWFITEGPLVLPNGSRNPMFYPLDHYRRTSLFFPLGY